MAYKDTNSKHAVAFEANQKVEALEWMKARQLGSMNTGEGCQGDDALSDVLGSKDKKRKEQLALMDVDEDEKDDEKEDEHPKSSSNAAALKKAVEDAEVLSDLGRSKNKEQAAKRVLKMIKVIKDVKKTADNAGQKSLEPALAELEKLSKKGSKLSLESCKDTLLDAALSVKKVQKAAKK